MKTTLSVAALLFSLSAGAEKEEWRVDSPPGGNFSVEMPGKVKSMNQQIPSPAGPLTMYGRACEMQRGRIAYLVLWNDIPQAALDAAAPEVLLKGGEQGAVSQFPGAKVESVNTDSYQKFPARTFTLTAKKDGQDLKMTVRLILAGSRLYQMQYIGTAGRAVPQDSADRFMKSLKITGAAGKGN